MGLAIRELDWRRSDIVVSTKIFWGGPGPNDKGFSRKHIIEGTKASLKRLDMDYVDVLYCHRPCQLQQFRQKKADKNTDHKKDPKGSTSQGNPPKNLVRSMSLNLTLVVSVTRQKLRLMWL
ncbi:probable voltage-gated potassium channel subunit beta [Brassica napus]|uniref:probable voltage-gated potassium channel subunit beta n=1 Tax=Brassica napus TaxID=3708 RepID=UPI002078E64D|nr:probable voltage-gated potassium channel subunit beta [Brassica napus]XP_048611267.1 probable voltage-gated potassium channel subunit beta [Brassica napus]XP_048636070.1 probable voltage-gated potassium channel subunit beta [Brassica napus]